MSKVSYFSILVIIFIEWQDKLFGDVEVKDELPWADGRDPIFEQGVETLYWSLRERLKKTCASGCY